MFTPEELESIPLAIEKLFKDLQLSVMSDIVRRLTNVQDISASADYQMSRLYELGKSKMEIQKLAKTALDKSDEEIDSIFTDIIQSGYARDKQLYTATGKDFIPYSENKPLKQLVKAMQKQTKDDCRNITQSMGFAVKQSDGKLAFKPVAKYYQDTLDKAVVDITSGGFDYNTVLNRTVSEMTNSGLRTVDYASGWSNRVNVAARRAVMTGVRQVTEKISEDNAEKLETEYFEVSWHRGARPSHQVFQGKVYSKDELVSVCGLGTVEGLGGANCYHSYDPFVMGVSERKYTDEWLDEQNSKENTAVEYGGKEYTVYEATQRQRSLETTMRAQREKIKLLEEGGADENSIIAAKARYFKTSDEYTRFSEAMDLPQQRERVFIDGKGIISNKSVAKTAESGIMNSEKEKSPRKNKNVDYSVDWSKIQSDEYSNKFKKLSDNKKVYSAIETRAKWALNNRDGLNTEEIYAVDLVKGIEVAKITDQQYERGVKRTTLFTRKLDEADSKGHKILLLHNHPSGFPPSISDINALCNNKNVSGITVGHNGSIYYYTRPNAIISDDDWNIAMRHFKKFSDVTAMEKTLDLLSKKYQFTFNKI